MRIARRHWTAHWPEYAIEAAALGAFMISACAFGVLLEHPHSRIHQALSSAFLRRALAGLAMGATAIAIISSPWGQRSGAHMNPAVTLSFLLLGKIAAWDATFYIAAQFVGGAAGVWLSRRAIGSPLADMPINYVATVPGPLGASIAFAAEFAIAAALMYALLCASNSRRMARYTPYLAGALVALYITFEAPLSGMSINPARSFGSALWADTWTAWWIYLIAPIAGMLGAAFVFGLRRRVFCAKLHHLNNQRCIFRCNFGELDAHQ